MSPVSDLKTLQLQHLLSIPAQLIWGVVAESWSALRGHSSHADVPTQDPSLRLLAEAVLDRTFTLFTHVLTGVPALEEARQANREAATARDLYASRGWLEDPARYHRTPPPLERVLLTEDSTWEGPRRRAYRQLTFESGFEPHVGEPGREGWLAHETNGHAHAYLLEHKGAPRPWLLCAHGFGMGAPWVTFSGFRASYLHEELGLNLVFPCLPLHGVRGSGRFSGRELLAPNYMRLVLWFAHAVWDVRRTLSWVRARSDAPIGLYGISLGSYVAALVASLEDGIRCVIAGLPLVDFANVARDNQPWVLSRYAERFGTDWELIRQLTHPVSPLAFSPRVPRERRFIYAGISDRVVRPEHALTLWRHWERPEIHWVQGGHVLSARKSSVGPFLKRSLRQAGMRPHPALEAGDAS